MTDPESSAAAVPTGSPPPPPTNGFALASLVLGIVSLVANVLFLPTVAGVVLGVLGLRRAPVAGRRGMAVAGIVLSAVGLVVGVVVLAVVLSLVVGAVRSAQPSEGVATPFPSGAPLESSAAPTPSAASFSYEEAGLEATLRTVDRQCFGSAGCSVGVEVELALDDTSAVPDDATGRVTYEITGDESGPIIGTIDLEGTSYRVPTENLSTESADVEVTVELTDVETD